MVKTFSDGQSVVDHAAALDCDVIVLDISMPGLNGMEAAQQLKGAGHKAEIVYLSVHQDPDYLRSALATGAMGYVVKDRLASDLVPALRAACAGIRFVSDSFVLDPFPTPARR